MIKRLRRKFVLIAMCSIAAVLLIVLGLINILNATQVCTEADWMIAVLEDNNGRLPMDVRGGRKPPMGVTFTPERPFDTRYFSVKLDQKGEIYEIDTGHIAAVSSSDAREYAEAAAASGSEYGFMGVYRYKVCATSYGSLVIFLDRSQQLQAARYVLTLSGGIFALCLIGVYIPISVLSKKAIKPVIENMEKQKQFITDAGHEIKTPLAIISANADVLELDTGKSEWIDSIRNQTQRLDGLVKSLLALSRMEDGRAEMTVLPFSISDAVEETATPFKTVAQSQGKRLNVRIQPALTFNGDEDGIRRLTSVLMDNAIKYSSENGEIDLTLEKSGKAIKLEVANDCDEPPQGDLNRLFDRFYRADGSRSRDTGGYGIGLSIARSIAEAHHGSIRAAVKEGKVIFTTILN